MRYLLAWWYVVDHSTNFPSSSTDVQSTAGFAQTFASVAVLRFFAGLFASAPLTLAGGTISDIWDNEERGFAIALFAGCS